MAYLLQILLDPEPDGGLPFKHDVVMFKHDQSGSWTFAGAAGSDWRFGFEGRPDGESCSFEGAMTDSTAPGVAGNGIALLSVHGDGWTSECRVEPFTGSFLIGADAREPVTVSAVDSKGRTVRTTERKTIWEMVTAAKSF